MDPRRRRARRGQAVVGVVLLVALVVVGTALVVAIGGQALTDTERRSDVQRAQQAMTLFDSQTAQVALGESDRQTVRFGRAAGTYSVDSTAGKISIINVDRDDDGDGGDEITWAAGDYPTDAVDGDGDGDIEYIHNETLGAVAYEGEDRTIAYQGGGVWQKDPEGGTRMVSPPEFHYREGTPMLPVIRVVGDGGAAGGSARATVSKGDFHARSIYPNASDSFDNGDPFRNPVENGSVVVRIESDYANAWGSYFEERTDGDVTYPAEGVVAVELVSHGQVGEFDMPLEGGAVTVTGVPDAHGVGRGVSGGTAFSVRLRPDDAGSPGFSNLQWSLYADEGPQQFEMHLKKDGTGDSCADGSTSTAAHLTVYYSWNGGADYHGWRTTDPVEAECANLDTSDAEDEIYFDITFVDDGVDPDGTDSDGDYDDDEDGNDLQLEFRELSSSDLERFSPNGDLNGSYPLDGHSAEGEPVTPTTGSPGTTRASDQLVNHYFAELPAEFDLRVDDDGSDTVDEEVSVVTFYSSGSGDGVTYLHVTATRVEVDIET